jgi:hypothetical protein
MGAQRQLLPVVAITGTSVLVGCGNYGSSYGSRFPGYCGGSGSYGGCYSGINPAAGIYEGTLTDPTGKIATPVVALVPENGPALLSAQNGQFYSLNVGIEAGSAQGTYSAFSTAGGLPNGGQSDSGNASLNFGDNTLSGTLTDQLGKTEVLTLNFDSRYNTPPASGALAGTWSSTANGLTLRLTVSASGSLSGDDSDGCTYSGNVTIIDRNYDMLNANVTRSCSSGNFSFLGLVSYLPAAGSAPAELQFMADDPSGDYLAFVLQPG